MNKLFQPIQLNTLKLKNRFFVPPMVSYHAMDDGSFSHEQEDHYAAFAFGGFGMITVEATSFEIESQGFVRGTVINKTTLDSHKQLVKRIHKYDSKIGIQLCHAGSLIPNKQYEGKEVKSYSDAEVNRVIELFKQGINDAKEAGYDYIEIHDAHGYFLDEYFTTEGSDWDLAKRSSVVKQILDYAITVMPTGIRISAYWNDIDKFPQHNLVSDWAQVLKPYIGKIEYVNVSTSGSRVGQYYNYAPAKELKDMCKDLDIIVTSGVMTLNDANKAESFASMVGIGTNAFKNKNILFDIAPSKEDAVGLSHMTVMGRIYSR